MESPSRRSRSDARSVATDPPIVNPTQHTAARTYRDACRMNPDPWAKAARKLCGPMPPCGRARALGVRRVRLPTPQFAWQEADGNPTWRLPSGCLCAGEQARALHGPACAAGTPRSRHGRGVRVFARSDGRRRRPPDLSPRDPAGHTAEASLSRRFGRESTIIHEGRSFGVVALRRTRHHPQRDSETL